MKRKKKNHSFLNLVWALLLLPLIIIGMKYPSIFYSPGDLVKAHEAAKCMECHAPFKRVPAKTCGAANCHDGPEIGSKPVEIDLHKRLAGSDCLTCHTDHKGVDARITHDFSHSYSAKKYVCLDCHEREGKKAHRGNKYGTDCQSCHKVKKWKGAAFSHKKFENKACVDCHRGEDTDVHKGRYSTDCALCHQTDSWKDVNLDHSNLKVGSCLKCHRADLKGGSVHKKGNYGDDCLACHKTKDWKNVHFSHNNLAKKSACVDCHTAAKDRLHSDAGTDCAACHKTTAWKPSTYKHKKYFPLKGKHKVRCSKCHDSKPIKYNKYTCMNCHKHSTKKIKRKHRKKKIRGFYGDCLRCHRVHLKGKRYGTRKVHDSMVDD